ncbi:MAG: DUF4276 family protein [Phycisphaerae bacterium]|nr:DUF4276 family protein [Phycisphaerae bacterium]
MSEIVAIVEGETEQTFVRDQLAAHLGYRGIAIWAVLPGRTRKRGGVKKWESASGDIIRTLKEGRYCTTMFDYYAMPTDWPGRAKAAQKGWAERGSHVESAVLNDIAERMGGSFNRSQFIPYVQVHEFEALMFSDVQELAETSAPLCRFSSAECLERQFRGILEEAGNPEAINDNYDTCPSRRITRLVQRYRKCVHGPIVAQRIGLETLRAECEHFATWIEKLEQL